MCIISCFGELPVLPMPWRFTAGRPNCQSALNSFHMVQWANPFWSFFVTTLLIKKSQKNFGRLLGVQNKNDATPAYCPVYWHAKEPAADFSVVSDFASKNRFQTRCSALRRPKQAMAMKRLSQTYSIRVVSQPRHIFDKQWSQPLKSGFRTPVCRRQHQQWKPVHLECLCMVIELILAIFLQRTTKTDTTNSSKPSSQTAKKDESALGHTGSKGSINKQDFQKIPLKKKPKPFGLGFLDKALGNSLLSHGNLPHYHRR